MLADNMLRARGPEADDSAGRGRRNRRGRGRENAQEEGASKTKEGNGRSVTTVIQMQTGSSVPIAFRGVTAVGTCSQTLARTTS